MATLRAATRALDAGDVAEARRILAERERAMVAGEPKAEPA